MFEASKDGSKAASAELRRLRRDSIRDEQRRDEHVPVGAKADGISHRYRDDWWIGAHGAGTAMLG